MSQLVKLELPPGLSRIGTLYQTQGRWYDSNFVRWYQGGMQPIGGWAVRISTAMTGVPRAIHTWRSNDLTRYIAVGTEQKLYAATPSLTAAVDITPAGFTAGRADASAVGGYGAGYYGAGTYGSARVDNVSVQDASMWQLDNFGQYLIGVMAEDGKLYEWQLDIGTPTVAAVVSGAPTGNASVLATPDHFVMLLGAGGDPRKVQWCDQGDETTWTATSTNQAGDFNLQSQSRIMCGVTTRNQTLIFTETDAHVANYVGLPYVYTIDRVGENCGIISRGAVAALDSRAWWMEEANFFYWDGASVIPVSCDVYDAVFGDMNLAQRSKIVAGINSNFSEVWWLYPSSGSTENDMIVVYNYLENHWALHALSRTCMCDHSVFNYPILGTSDGLLYDHETGYTWDGTDPYAESGPVEMGNGDRQLRVMRLIFDERTQGDVSVTVLSRNWNNDADVTYGPYSSPNPVNCRIAGRALRQKVAFQGNGRWGTLRADADTGARR